MSKKKKHKNATPGRKTARRSATKADFDSVVRDKSELHPEGASDESIGEVAEQLGVKIPSALREFLLWRDGGMLANKRFIVFSAGDGIDPAETLVAANENRDSNHPMLNIARDATFDFGFKLKETRKANPPVYGYFYETGELEKVADDFVSWLKWAQDIAKG